MKRRRFCQIIIKNNYNKDDVLHLKSVLHKANLIITGYRVVFTLDAQNIWTYYCVGDEYLDEIREIPCVEELRVKTVLKMCPLSLETAKRRAETWDLNDFKHYYEDYGFAKKHKTFEDFCKTYQIDEIIAKRIAEGRIREQTKAE